MNFEVDRYSSAWAHIALCADLTWAAEPPDEFVIANQRLWAQHCRVSQALQGQTLKSQNLQLNSQYELAEKRSSTSQILENGNSSCRRSVKDVIPESRLAQFYGNFYYDDLREKCYTNAYEKSNGRGYNGQGCENSDLTECWMLPEVEYWFRKLVEEPSERGMVPRRLRQYRILGDSDLIEIKWHRSAASERWDLTGPRSIGEEATLAARVRSVRSLWAPRPSPRAPSPLPAPGKIRARRRQPRWLASLAPPPPTYCLEAPAQLFCDPTCKFQFDSPRLPQLTECQRAMGRLSASVQALMRASAARCPPYRGTNVSRYAPTSQRSARCPDRRYGVWWARDRPSPRLDHRFHLTHIPHTSGTQKVTPIKSELIDAKPQESTETSEPTTSSTSPEPQPSTSQQSTETLIPESPRSTQQDQLVTECQLPTSSSTTMDIGLSKRLYSTVLSAPPTINLTPVGCVRLSQNQKLVTPGLLKLNPKIVLPRARMRPPNAEKKFDELEKEALEQYKASDESIDTKFSELEKQAVEQYSTSNSNTSCSSGNSVEKRTSTSPLGTENGSKNRKQDAKTRKEKAVDSVVIYSQNFPDLKAKRHTSVTNLKNFQAPLRGEKKDQIHRSNKSLRSLKNKAQRAASDTDYDSREKGSHKGAMRWTLHMVPPKKRHLTVCVSDFSSDEEANGALRAGTRVKNHVTGKVKLSAHGGGDLNPIMRKT